MILVSDRFVLALGAAEDEFRVETTEPEPAGGEEAAPRVPSSLSVDVMSYSKMVEYLCRPLPTEIAEDVNALKMALGVCSVCREMSLALISWSASSAAQVGSAEWIYDDQTGEWGCLGGDNRYYCSQRCSRKSRSVRDFPETEVAIKLEEAELTYRHRAQGFMVSSTRLALHDHPDLDPLTEPVARALG